MTARRLLGAAGALLFVAALPMLLIATNVRVLFTTPPLYTLALNRYDAPTVTGIPHRELSRSMSEIRTYFTDDRQTLEIRVADTRGGEQPLFTAKEVVHMADVKQIVQTFFAAQWVGLAVVVGYGAVSLVGRGRAAWLHLAKLAQASMLGTLGLAVAFSIAAVVGFDQLFTRFHMVFFPNGGWQFDPSRDRLVQLFPYDFWLASTGIFAAITLLEILAVLAASYLYLRRAAYSK